MLIKVNSRMWENFNCVNSLSLQRCIRGTGKDVYIVNICVDGKEVQYNQYDSKEEIGCWRRCSETWNGIFS